MSAAQLSYTHGASAVPLLGETIGENLRRTVERWGDREALVVVHQSFRATYRDLWDLVDRCARGLLACGIQKGDRVGMWAPNRYEWVVVQYATARVGAILVNINPAYRAHELGYVLGQSGIRMLIHSRGFRRTEYGPLVAEARGSSPDLTRVLGLEDGWDALLADGARVDGAELARREASLQCDDAINIQYTSGTTGFPKGATLSHHNILNNGFFIGEGLALSPADRVCIPVPFYHCFGMVLGNLACTTHGACIVVPSEAFDPLSVLEAVQAERCTALYGVPTMFISELALPEIDAFDLSSLRTGIMAGSPCPIEVMRKVQATMHMPEITICYGMTETSPVSTQTRIGDPLEKVVGTVGRIHPHVEIKIVDAGTGLTVERGVPGELCTRGYSVMLGYWSNDQATAEAIDQARWMHTGDLATMDEDGYVNIVGRIKDMVIRGGENVYPREIEEFLYTHPDVVDVQVIGVPSEKYGEEIMAWVKPRAGAAISGDVLEAYCRGKIATYKIPRYWKLVESFPMTVTGKIRKVEMREIAVAELGLQRAAEMRTA